MRRLLARAAGLLEGLGAAAHRAGDMIGGYAEALSRLADGPRPDTPLLALVEPSPGAVIVGDGVAVRYSVLWRSSALVRRGILTLDGKVEALFEPPSGSVVFADVTPGPHVLTGILIGPMGLPVEGSLAQVEFSTRLPVPEASS